MTTHNKPQTEQTKKADPNCNLCHGTGVTGGHDGLLEFECICLDEPTQNEPQLSAEMEAKFDKEFDSLWEYNSTSNLENKTYWVKHFLATALEEQKAQFKENVYEHDKRVKAKVTAEYVRRVNELPVTVLPAMRVIDFNTGESERDDLQVVDVRKVIALLGKEI